MMKNKTYSVITGSGRYVPTNIVKNEDFRSNEFFEISGEKIIKKNEEIIEKFQQITGINERRYVDDNYSTSDIGYFAALDAIKSSGTNKETFDYIIVAHNFGDVLKLNPKSDMVPSLASRIKFKLGIKNPYTVAYDLPFGCPGWLQAFIQADYYIKSGDAKKILVIGTEVLSRVSDPHDLDSMIYSDGAGAVIVEAKESSKPIGVLAHKTRSDTHKHCTLLRMDVSNNPSFGNDTLFLKMEGRKLYEYAITTVPELIKECIVKSGLSIGDFSKLLIHQANEKMDDKMLSNLLKLYGIKEIPENFMPMTISYLGNNSVATIPILFDMIFKNEFKNHHFLRGDNVIFASVGAGMNINALIYRFP